MFEDFTKENNLESYRINQLYQQYYKDGIQSWDELTNWPLTLREKIKEEIPFSVLNNQKEFKSKDKRTIKLLSLTQEGYPVESVLMKSKKRNTVCVSCMSGCPVGCSFCATGQMKFNKNLTTREIVDQILYFKRTLKTTGRENEVAKITNIVFMGMGEPMLNLVNITNAIEILTDAKKLAMGSRRITVSTVGYVDQLRKFLNKDLGVKIAISLHAPNQELREILMPTVAKNNHIDDLMSLLINFQKRTNKKITYEYLLIQDLNDKPEHAKELAKLLKNQVVLVNLIRLNPSPTIPFRASNKKGVQAFQNILESRGINNTLRHSYGNEINAACGQLAGLNTTCPQNL